jgi:2-polyprenyl-3-methyl-5-hydroxy-6-metoxy-1,4-benzoquinol methylase
MPDFSNRSNEVEIMDNLESSGEVVYQTLRELETINDLLGGNYVTIAGVARLSESSTRHPVSLADLGCGSGDMLKRIRRWAQKKGIPLQLTGIDANPHIVSYARINTPPECEIEYEAIDIFSDEFKTKRFDIVAATLFFHHFTDEQLISFFSQLKQQVTEGIIINDIHRHWLAYYSIRWLTRLFSRSSMVKYDAPLSVLRAFKKHELTSILERSGFKNFTIKWMWAFRWQVIIQLT